MDSNQLLNEIEAEILHSRMTIKNDDQIPPEFIQAVTGYPTINKVKQETDTELRRKALRLIRQKIDRLEDFKEEIKAKVLNWHKNSVAKVEMYDLQTRWGLIKSEPWLLEDKTQLQLRMFQAEYKIFCLIKKYIYQSQERYFDYNQLRDELRKQKSIIKQLEYIAKEFDRDQGEEPWVLNRVYFEGALEHVAFVNGSNKSLKNPERLKHWLNEEAGNSSRSGRLDERFEQHSYLLD